MKFIIVQTEFKNRPQLIFLEVKQILEVFGKLKIITEYHSYLSQMIDSYVFAEKFLAIFYVCKSAHSPIKADNTWVSPFWLFIRLKKYRQVKTILCDAPPPVLSPRVLSLTCIHRIVLVKRRNFYEEWNISCFLVPIVFSNHENASSVWNFIWTQEHSYKYGSFLRHNSAFAHIGKLVCRVSNRF